MIKSCFIHIIEHGISFVRTVIQINVGELDLYFSGAKLGFLRWYAEY